MRYSHNKTWMARLAAAPGEPRLWREAPAKWVGLCVSLLSIVILGLGLRGSPGNPTAEMLNLPEWKEGGPLELSPERGRFAITYSIVEDKSFVFSLPIARFVAPDLAINPREEYVSLFAPTVSLLAVSGYVLGKWFGAAQVGTYAVVALFTLFNLILIRAIVGRLGGATWAGWLGGFVFVFATPAFAYGVTLYQHHVSTFLILASLYALLRWKGWVPLALVWFLCGLSIAVDNPNFFLMLPIGIYALMRIVFAKRDKRGINIGFKPLYALTFAAMLLPIVLFLGYNQAINGDPFKLSGALPGVAAIGADGRPARSQLSQTLGVEDRGTGKDKSAVAFFNTRNLFSGFYIHLFSPDRGVIRYTPVILLGVWGLVLLYRKRPSVAALLSAIALANLILYSMWGDPWGGWAFGSRYLIPAYALLGIGLALALDAWRKNVVMLAIFFLFFAYSAGVNTLGAVTSSANPPQAEVLNLEKLTGREQKYTFMRNWQHLNEHGSKSFVYQVWGKHYVSAVEYYYLVLGLVIVGGGGMVLVLNREPSFVRTSAGDARNKGHET